MQDCVKFGLMFRTTCENFHLYKLILRKSEEYLKIFEIF